MEYSKKALVQGGLRAELTSETLPPRFLTALML